MLIKALVVVFGLVMLMFGASKDVMYGGSVDKLESLIINPAQACCKG